MCRRQRGRVSLLHDVERVVVDVDSCQVIEAVLVEVCEVPARATAEFEDGRVSVDEAIETLETRCARPGRSRRNTRGVLSGPLCPLATNLVRIHVHHNR